MGRKRRRVALFSLLLLLAAPAGADFLLNEVLYDPPGSDGDGEFVELILMGADSLGTAGLRLEFCNGSTPGDWLPLWEGNGGGLLGPGTLYLLAEPDLPGAQEHLTLDLQNGPEALRLLRGGRLLDLLGYGEDLDASLYEAWPAVDCSGVALARRPDGVDTDQNALDWFPVEPTPGLLNLPDFQVRLEGAEAPWLPLAPGQPCSLKLSLRNSGGLPWPLPLHLEVDGREAGQTPRLDPEQLGTLSLVLWPPPGESMARLTVMDPGGLPADSLLLQLRADLGSLRLEELLFAPDGGEPEWLECLCLDAQDGFESYRLRDLGGTEAVFRPPAMAGGARFLLTGDRDALLIARPDLPAGLVFELSPWPSLANSGRSAWEPAWTDGLRLDDASGRRVDALLYRGEWIPARGRSIERLADHPVGNLAPWSACPSGATPLTAAPAAPLAEAGPLALGPNPFDPDREHLGIELRAAGGDLEVLLFDAAGRFVQRLAGTLAAGRARLLWDGRDAAGRRLPDGAYPLLLRWEAAGGRPREAKAVAALMRGSGS